MCGVGYNIISSAGNAIDTRLAENQGDDRLNTRMHSTQGGLVTGQIIEDNRLYSMVRITGTVNVLKDAISQLSQARPFSAFPNGVFRIAGGSDELVVSSFSAGGGVGYDVEAYNDLHRAMLEALGVPIPTVQRQEFGTLGQFVTKFKEPFVFRGWPVTRAWFVRDANLFDRVPTPLTFVVTNRDINKGGNLGEFRSALSDTSLIAVIGRALFSLELTPDTHYQSGRLVDEASGDSDTLDELFFKVVEPCKNPIGLRWLNSLGGLEVFVFSLDTIFNRNVTEGLVGQISINKDIENVSRTEERLPLHWWQEAILTAENLTIDQAKAMAEIKTSPVVQVLLSKDGLESVGIIVNNLFASEYNNNDTDVSVEVQIKFPNNFDFETGKLY